MVKNWLKLGIPVVIFLVMSYSGCVVFVYPFKMLNKKHSTLKGTVVDQDGKPVPRAHLVFEEWERIFFLPSTFLNIRPKITRHVTSDDSGCFQVPFYLESLELKSGEKKRHILDRDMGVWSWTNNQREINCDKILFYDFSHADPSQVKIGVTSWFQYDTTGKDYFVDLSQESISGTPSLGSNLAFTIKDIGDGRFMLTVRGAGGGVIGSAHELPYAPMTGYVPGFSSFYTKMELVMAAFGHSSSNPTAGRVMPAWSWRSARILHKESDFTIL